VTTGIVKASLFPGVMGATIALAVVLQRAGWPAELWFFAAVATNLVAVAVLERLFPRVEGVDLLRDPQAPRDLIHALLTALVGSPLGSLAATLVLVATVGRRGVFDLWPTSWPLVVQVLLAWLIWGFFDYWKHRAYHRVDCFWWLHALHHDVDAMHVLKGGRLHLLEGTVRMALVAVPLIVLGAPMEVFLWMATVDSAMGNLSHSNLDQRFPRFAHWLVPTVDLHHIHHAADRSLHDTNLGVPIFDLLFGTYTSPAQVPRPAIGGSAGEVPPKLAGQLLFPLQRWLARA
jgi:sterol desaturase/sphingolipid hydroxylase (fatty acid hydroxylase superfamily)